MWRDCTLALWKIKTSDHLTIRKHKESKFVLVPIATLYGLDDFFCLGHLVHYDGAFTFYVLFFLFSEKSQIQIATLIYEDWMKLNVKTINTVNIQTWKLKFLENEKENTVIPSMIKFGKSTLIKENRNLFTTITKLS